MRTFRNWSSEWSARPQLCVRCIMRIESREYKVIVDSSAFAELDAALSDIRDDLADLARSIGLDIDVDFDVKDPKERSILFLDTPDHTMRLNGLLLRQRVKRKNGKTEYTLKCRSEDRYVAAGADVRAGRGFDSDAKFEEDIGVPFVSRFSRSNTVTVPGEKLPGD